MLKILLLASLTLSSLLFAEYTNSNGKALEKPFKDLVRWVRSDVEPKLAQIDISSEWQTINLNEADNFIIWIGHSTFLIKKEGITILTDPVFSNRASPFKNVGPERLIPPAMSIDQLPKIDFVTVSHNHYDHLDINSLKEISKLHSEAIFFVPIGDGKLLKRKRIKNVYEFNWWESYSVEGLTLSLIHI